MKAKEKQISNSETVLEAKKDTLSNLLGQKEKLEESLKKIFCKFVPFEDRNMKMKEENVLKKLTKRYFDKYREKVQDQIYAEKVLIHFSSFIHQKNNYLTNLSIQYHKF